jgi:AP-1 complex subunit mu
MDLKGKVIISKNYRGDSPMNVADRFSLYIQEKEEMELRPVFTVEGITYIYIKVILDIYINLNFN